MKTLAKAIKDKFTGDFALQGFLTGGLWLHQAPIETPLPYATFDLIAGSTDYTNTDVIETYTVEFAIYAEDVETVMETYSQINTTFNLQTLTYDTGAEVSMRRESMTGPVELDSTFQVTTDYEVMRSEVLT